MDTFKNGFALLIGVNDNELPRLKLPAVEKDIDALYNVLTNPKRCGYPENQVKKITGAEATKDGIFAGLSWLKKAIKADENATVLVYFSGHGMSKPNADYLIPYDLKGKGSLRNAAIKTADFGDELNDIDPARLLTIFDCCHAEMMHSVAKGDAEQDENEPDFLNDDLLSKSPDPTAADFAVLSSGGGRVMLCSSKGEQSSYIRKDQKMSIFTWHLIEALMGNLTELLGESEVRASDLIPYLERTVSRSAQSDWSKPQTPTFKYEGEGFPIALVAGGEGHSSAKGFGSPEEMIPAGKTYSIGNVTGNNNQIVQGDGNTVVGAGGVSIGGNVQGNIDIQTGGSRTEIKSQTNIGKQTNIGTVSGDFVAGDKVEGDQYNASGDININRPKR